MNGVGIWIAILGEHGPMVGAMLGALAGIPPSAITEALHRIDRETAIGPLTDPSAYLDGTRWKNAEQYKGVLEALLALRKVLPEPPAPKAD